MKRTLIVLSAMLVGALMFLAFQYTTFERVGKIIEATPMHEPTPFKKLAVFPVPNFQLPEKPAEPVKAPVVKKQAPQKPAVAVNVYPGLLEEVNAYRASKGLPAVVVNYKLQQSSQLKANDMVTQNYWAHRNPQGNNAQFFARQVGYRGVMGENLARNFSTAKGITNAWINSPSHNAVLLGNYTEVGFTSAYNASDGLTYVVAHFGRR